MEKIKSLRKADWEFRKAIIESKANDILPNFPGIVHKNHIVRKNIGTEDKPVLGPENADGMVSYSDKYRLMICKQIAKWHLDKQEEQLVAFAKKNGVRDASETLIADSDGNSVVVTHKQKAFCWNGEAFEEL